MRRRAFLQLAALAPALAILEQPPGRSGVAFASVRSPDAAGDLRAGAEAARLRPEQGALLQAVIERLVETGERDAPAPAEVGVLGAVEDILSRLDPAVADALGDALTWIDWWPVFGELRLAGFASLDPDAQRESLEGWRTSRLEARRQVYRALRSLSLLAYWSRPETWPLIGYPGPSTPRTVPDAPQGERSQDPSRSHKAESARLAPKAGATLRTDVCVIGAGAGGSVVAALLAEAGRRVVLLEAGPNHERSSFDQREDSMLPELYVDGGSRATANGEIAILQGRGLGGSTVPGLGYCLRTPRSVLAAWHREHGVAGLDSLGAAFARVETALGVRPVTPAEVNALNAALRSGSTRLGYHGRLAHHNRTGCQRSGSCLLGCPYGALRSMRVSYLPRALRAGARILSSAHAEVIGGDPGRREVEVRLASGGGLRVEAPLVVCAAGAIGTPLLLAASGLAEGSGQLGRHLRLQPSVVTTGIFSKRMAAWEGMPAAWYIDEFQRPPAAGDSYGGYALTAFSAFPAMTAAGLPGSGPELFATLRDYPKMGGLRAVLRDRSEGQVVPSRSGSAEIRYELGKEDRRTRVRAVKRSIELLWASGASEVRVPFRDGVRSLSPSDGMASIDRNAGGPGALSMLSTEPLGTCRMGSDPAASVVNSHGEVHDAPGVFVSDASALPSPPGVPPLITIAALADRSARQILRRRDPETA